MGIPDGPLVKNPPANAADIGLIPDQKNSTCWDAIKPTYPTLESVCHD